METRLLSKVKGEYLFSHVRHFRLGKSQAEAGLDFNCKSPTFQLNDGGDVCRWSRRAGFLESRHGDHGELNRI